MYICIYIYIYIYVYMYMYISVHIYISGPRKGKVSGTKGLLSLGARRLSDDNCSLRQNQ